MAIYHLHVDMVSRKTGRSAVAAAAYRSADKLKNERDGMTHDYTNRSSVGAAAYRSGERLTNEQGKAHDFSNKRGVVHSEIMLPENAPQEYMDRAILWNAVEKSEKRKDAQTARDIDVALPVEFDRQEQIEVLREYIQDNFVSHGMIADFAIHDKGDGNPHAHILLTTRKVTEKGFGNKNRDWNDKTRLEQWRENWSAICNERLQVKGLDERIDHRTLKAQGIDREPTIHIGVAAKAMERKGIVTEPVKKNQEIISRNQARSIENTAKYMHQLKREHFILEMKTAELTEIANNAKREMNAFRIKAEDITERAEHIHTMKERFAELSSVTPHPFRANQTKTSEIQQLERSYEQATSYFKNKYQISPEQAAAEIQMLESDIESKKNLQEKLKTKIDSFDLEKEEFALEYQRQQLLAEINPDGQKIQDRLAELEKESQEKGQSAQEKLSRAQTERTLDVVSEKNFHEILKDVKPEQAQELIRRRARERARERERFRTFGRGR